VRHVTASEPSRRGRRDPEPRDTWQRQSPLKQGGRNRSHRTRGSAGALLSMEVESNVVGHVAVCLPCLGFKPVCGGT
jgi:hypothetical protein